MFNFVFVVVTSQIRREDIDEGDMISGMVRKLIEPNVKPEERERLEAQIENKYVAGIRPIRII